MRIGKSETVGGASLEDALWKRKVWKVDIGGRDNWGIGQRHRGGGVWCSWPLGEERGD